MPTYLLYKPFNMLSQFTREAPHHITLADLAFNFPKDVYPVGRLDADSEGLLLLTNDKRLNAKLLHPKNKQPKTYWVQVEGVLADTPNLPERNPPIRVRKSIPDTWVSITITEGKNRQVRRMFAAVGFPVLRLVRVGLAGFMYGEGKIGKMNSGAVVKVGEL